MGHVLISLDCEGLWGMADSASTHRTINDESLTWAYWNLFDSLSRWDLRATFAFVGLFAQPAEQVHDQWPKLLESPSRRKWLTEAVGDHHRGALSGWHLPWAVDEAATRGHEIASHSYTHLPLAGTNVDDADVRFEFDQAMSWGRESGHEVRTYIFPRNQVPSRALIEETSLVGYREAPESGHIVARLADEVNPWRPSSRQSCGRPVAIPGDHFMNWRSGGRLVIPPVLTVRGWAHALRHASQQGGVAHLWFHPHNLITGRRQHQLMEHLLRVTRAQIDRSEGSLINATQAEYVDLLPN